MSSKTRFYVQGQLWGAVAVLLSALVYFWNLNGLPIQIWDESRYVNSALELATGRAPNFWIPTHIGLPDHFNTKPPLGIWLLSAIPCTTGIIEPWAFRWVSAIAAVLTGWILHRYILKREKYLASILAPLVLVTLPGFVEIHGTRTADLDALMTLWLTGMLVSWLRLLAFLSKKTTPAIATRNWAYLGLGLSMAAALWTKGAATLLYYPVLLGGLMFYPRAFVPLLRNWRTYLVWILPHASLLMYYWARNQVDLGFIEALIQQEFKRSSQSAEGHVGGIFYYLEFWVTGQMGLWVLVLALITFMGLFVKSRLARVGRLAWVAMAVFGVTISLMATKCAWYDLPIYPLVALAVSLGIQSSLEWLEVSPRLRLTWGVFVACVLAFQGVSIAHKVNLERNYQWPFSDYKEEHFYHLTLAMDSLESNVLALTQHQPIVLVTGAGAYNDQYRLKVAQWNQLGIRTSIAEDAPNSSVAGSWLVPGADLGNWLTNMNGTQVDTLCVYHYVYWLKAKKSPIPK